MAISSGLHKIRSSRSVSPATVAMLANTEGTMQAPQDDIEEGERINGFWTACSLLKNLAVTLDPPSNSCVVFEGFGMDNIDTPWPLDMESYEAVRIFSTRETILYVLMLNRMHRVFFPQLFKGIPQSEASCLIRLGMLIAGLR